MTPKEKADKAWREHQGWFETSVGTYYQGIPHGRNVLTDYKAALRREIEKKIMSRVKDDETSQAFGRNFGSLTMKELFKLIDTVSPE